MPALILIGAADTVTPAAACRELVRNQSAADVKLVVYPGAGHVFDDPQYVGGKQVMGMWLQFDLQAASLSQSALRDFLTTMLGR
jgi:dienelactone hydrolase